MQPIQAHTLNVPGANLYYEVRGSGPVLLLICGGPRREPARSSCWCYVPGSFGNMR